MPIYVESNEFSSYESPLSQEDAIKARLEAEEKYFAPILEKYKKTD